MLFNKLQIRHEFVGHFCFHTRWWSLRNWHRLTRLRTCSRGFLLDHFSCFHRTAACCATYRKTLNKYPTHKRHWLAANETTFIEQPLVFTVEFLVTVIRQDGRIHLVCDCQHKSISTTNSASWWCYEFIICDCLFEFGGLFFSDAMTKSCVNNDRDLCILEFIHQCHDGFVKLGKAWHGSTLCRNVRSVDDDVFGHPCSQPPEPAV